MAFKMKGFPKHSVLKHTDAENPMHVHEEIDPIATGQGPLKPKGKPLPPMNPGSGGPLFP